MPNTSGEQILRESKGTGRDQLLDTENSHTHTRTHSFMAKFFAELLACTLPDKGTSPVFEVRASKMRVLACNEAIFSCARNTELKLRNVYYFSKLTLKVSHDEMLTGRFQHCSAAPSRLSTVFHQEQ